MLLIQKREIGVSICNLPVGITEAHIREIIDLTGMFKANENPGPGEVVVFPKDFKIEVMKPFQNRRGHWMTRVEVKLDTSGFIDEETGIERRLTISECKAVEDHILDSFNIGVFVNVTSQGALAIAMPGEDALFLGDGSRSCYYHTYRSKGRNFTQVFLRMHAEKFKIRSVDVPPKPIVKSAALPVIPDSTPEIKLDFSATLTSNVETVISTMQHEEEEELGAVEQLPESQVDFNLNFETEMNPSDIQLEIKV